MCRYYNGSPAFPASLQSPCPPLCVSLLAERTNLTLWGGTGATFFGRLLKSQLKRAAL